MSDSKKPKISEIRVRQGVHFRGGGTTVTNCVQHMGLPLTSRPFDCRLCQTDIRNEFSRAVKVNERLNDQLDSARIYIPHLFDLVERMGKAMEHLLSQSEIAEFNNMSGTATCEICGQVGKTISTIEHKFDCSVKEARALLEELKQ